MDARGAEHGTEAGDPMLATERNLQDYQRRLQGLLDQLTQASDLARGQDLAQGATQPGAPSLSSPAYMPPDQSEAQGQTSSGQSSATLLGGILPRSATPKAAASMLGNRSLTLPKGTSFSCALKTRIVSASAGLVSCMVQRNVYGDDGRVLLIERGSHLDGEYRVTTVRPGTVHIPVLWTRVRTPLGVTVDIDSPATGQLGESGIDGHVDNRWSERIGAAMLLSLIDDSVQLIASKQSEEHRSGTVVLSSTTSNTSKLAEKVLDSTINIPPTIYRNQGGIAAIHVARDIDFSGVYELQPSAP
ncbi:type IV secretion system protein VirB10 [Paucibacter sp. O1-1]|nr:type IV secretion system protein VirB10 [Paucibacter sp. O1-1]MDA3831256.1 type IV secretion system protein VirB10 [Paucibacter sp. O1-1]